MRIQALRCNKTAAGFSELSVRHQQAELLVDLHPCRPPQILPPGADPLEPFQGPSYYFFKCAFVVSRLH